MRLGVLGTMVWDRIYSRDGRTEPIEEWGGIAYALAAASAAAPRGATVVPLCRIGADLADRAFSFLRSLPNLDLESGIRIVTEPNNRVELRYQDQHRRCERQMGNVGGWGWPDLEPIVMHLDALYINFISGSELTLAVAQTLRARFPGPIYADLHSLLLGIEPGGMRVLQPLDAWREWLRCFDVVQLNEDELRTLALAWGDPWRLAADVVGDQPRLLLVTLADRGAVYFAAPDFEPDARVWRRPVVLTRSAMADGAVRTQRIPPQLIPRAGDPTGCGDVWGASFFATLLAHADLEHAMRRANAAAGRNVEHRGATGLHHHLLGRLGT